MTNMQRVSKITVALSQYDLENSSPITYESGDADGISEDLLEEATEAGAELYEAISTTALLSAFPKAEIAFTVRSFPELRPYYYDYDDTGDDYGAQERIEAVITEILDQSWRLSIEDLPAKFTI